MHFSYDPDVDILMVYLKPLGREDYHTFSHSEGSYELGYVLDKNKDSTVTDIEIFDASKHYPLEDLMKYKVNRD